MRRLHAAALACASQAGAGRRHGDAAGPANSARRAGDQPGAAPDDRSRRSTSRRGGAWIVRRTRRSRSRSRAARRSRRRPGTRASASSAGFPSSARPASSCPISCAAWIHSIHSGIDVARAAGLDACGRLDRQHVRGGRARPLRPSRYRAPRHGRFRRRAAEVSARPSDPEAHHRRRLRQADEARAGRARPALVALGGRPRVSRRPGAEARRRTRRWSTRSRSANTAAKPCPSPSSRACRLPTLVADAARTNGKATCSATAPVAVNVLIVDREGRELAETGHG